MTITYNKYYNILLYIYIYIQRAARLTDMLLLHIQKDVADSFHVRHRNTSVDIMFIISLTDFKLVFTVYIIQC